MNETELAALTGAERYERDQAARLGRAPAYPLYKTGAIVGTGTVTSDGYHVYDDEGLRGAIGAAEAASRTTALVHVAARRVAEDRWTIVAAFAGGAVIPVDEARRIAANGYTS
jgi:hypothetical protein